MTTNLEWLPKLKGGSRFGWHYLSDFTKCETYWYHRNLHPHPNGGLGLQQSVFRPALDIGSRVHTMLEAWYRGGWKDGADSGVRNLDTALAASMSLNEESSEEQFDAIATADRLVRAYHDAYQSDWPHKQVASFKGEPAIEVELDVDVGYMGYRFTSRLDLVWHFNGYLWSLEHKTSAANQVTRLLDRVDIDGQFTGQYWQLVENFPDDQIGGVTVDVLVKDRGGKSTLPTVYRKDTARTPDQLEKFRLDIARKLDRIENSVGNYRELLVKGLPHDDAARVVFDGSPDGYQCVGAWGKCDFYDLCLNRRVSESIIKGGAYQPREYAYNHENPFNTEMKGTNDEAK